MPASAPPPDDETLRRLRWHCRRGTKELDLLLLRYVDQVYPGADVAVRQDFERLLETQDPELAGWLYGRDEAADPALRSLVAVIRALPAPSR